MTQPGPPYLRIADEIRRHIADGVLREGDHVPSARRITRDYGVALATATKALAALQADGLTRAVPGVGTVVAAQAPAGPAQPGPAAGTAPRPASVPKRPAGEADLTREKIVRKAIGIADAEGMAQLSMRRIAGDLGVATMSLYRHVGGKEELVVYMIDSAFTDFPLPERAPTGWRRRLEVAARLQWQGFRRHPWLAPALSMTRPQLIPNGMRHTEWVFASLEGLDLSPEEMLYVHLTLFGFGRGLAMNLELEAQAEQDTGLSVDEWLQTQEQEFQSLLQQGEFPAIERMFRHDVDMDLDILFEFGLTRLLDGLDRFFTTRTP
ncbi:TetR/AcrR family transcriptional regulator C-terminal domain-containing protein [Hamadaea tsunoensis]|uniref:TetR/AcrR family transcriptional regulator C-terminal domain-containing protein n=1 Tax=Hamadaea tsunoensis TaxID=53368 RepID=UPI0004150324|nr:TetR/AcrR family transcriptional regulator C-terminal domain-containing protein [Hamadaea tsunoensis]